ncbi:GL10524 [Drosophila persimilis]|uniref:GL10524 n=1 Tax=Drosophila persimilis TaxID=7234 RepID=B4GBF5_DROPE|nr:glomulin [Drosophila persimilis]EDW32257.1 GL10524 [Drosophila persimilis]
MEPAIEANAAAANLLRLIKQLLLEKAYDGVRMLFQSPNEASRNIQHMPLIAMDIYNDICVVNLVDEVNGREPELFDCANELLKLLAEHAPVQEMMMELMEKIEESRSHAVFAAYLRALQVILVRQGQDKPQAVMWCLQSVFTRLKDLPLPEYLSEGYDEAAGRLVEQDKQVEDLLAHYITVGLFEAPLLVDILQRDPRPDPHIFRHSTMSRRNALTCFLVQLLGKPLALLEMSYVKDDLTHTYVHQVVKNLTQEVTKSMGGDPFYLLALVEKRARWERKLNAAKGVYEMTGQNVFLIEDMMPLHAMAMYYHALFVRDLLPPTTPKIYSPLFLFESSLYLVVELLRQPEPPLQHCGLRLLEHVLINRGGASVPHFSLQLDVHKRFCDELCKIVGYSPQVGLRQLGLHVLRHYILAFDDQGKCLILKNLLETLQHDGLMGYLSAMFKDLVDKALMAHIRSGVAMPSEFRGKHFREMLMLCVCVLPNDVKSDLLLHADRICNAINILRYFALSDRRNVTGFWDILPEIEKRLLVPLGTALDFSMAHYKAYKERVENGQSASDDALMKKQLQMLAVNITNSGIAGEGDSSLPDIGRQEKLDVLTSSITSLEWLLSIYVRANEVIEQTARQRKLLQDAGPVLTPAPATEPV